VCERLPEDKWALGFAVFAFPFTIGGGIIGVGCPYIGKRENNKTSGDYQGGE
jgi:hypothetical protein